MIRQGVPVSFSGMPVKSVPYLIVTCPMSKNICYLKNIWYIVNGTEWRQQRDVISQPSHFAAAIMSLCTSIKLQGQGPFTLKTAVLLNSTIKYTVWNGVTLRGAGTQVHPGDNDDGGCVIASRCSLATALFLFDPNTVRMFPAQYAHYSFIIIIITDHKLAWHVSPGGVLRCDQSRELGDQYSHPLIPHLVNVSLEKSYAW